MKKLVSHIAEIEVPDDFPSASAPQAVFDYVGKHPEVGDQIIREYRKAYSRWIMTQRKESPQ